VGQEQRLLFREIQKAQGAPLFSQKLCIGFRIRGAVQQEAIQEALDALVRRHASLRVRIVTNDFPEEEVSYRALRLIRTGTAPGGTYSQTVERPAPVPLSPVKLTDDRGGAEWEEMLQRLVDEEVLRSNPELAPPHMRAILAEVGAEDRILAVFVEHLVADGLTMAFLRQEFRDALLFGLGHGTWVESVEGQYLLDAQAEASRIEQGRYEEFLDYWQTVWTEYFHHRIAPGHFSFVRPLTNNGGAFRAARAAIDLERANAIKEVCKRTRVTLHAFFLAAFALQLYVATGKRHLPVWKHFANRNDVDRQRAAGWFAQTHLVGLEVDSKFTVQDLLLHAHHAVLQAAKYQDCPPTLIWNHLWCYPQFQDAKVLIDFMPYSSRPNDLIPGLSVEDIFLRDDAAPRWSPLGTYVQDLGREFSVCVRYNEKLFSSDGVSDFLSNYLELVGRMSLNPDFRIGELAKPAAPTLNTRIASEAMSALVVDPARSTGLFRNLARKEKALS
jgi:hypothetical protein